MTRLRTLEDFTLAVALVREREKNPDVLGDFRVPGDALAFCDYYHRYEVKRDPNRSIESMLNDTLRANKTNMLETLSEMLFWWKKSGDEYLISRAGEVIETRGDSDGILERIEHLSLIADSDKSARAFFAQDIWDMDVINGFLDNDVDPRMIEVIR